MKKITILHILWSGRSGGAEKFLLDIIINANSKRYEHMVCFLSQGGWLADKMAESGTNVYYLGMRSGFSVIHGFQFIKLVKQINPDIINIHNRNYLVNLLTLFFLKKINIYFEHGGGLIGSKPKREILFYKYIGRFYNLILANSDYVKDKIIKTRKINPKKVKTFYIGIEPDNFKNSCNSYSMRQQLGISKENKVVGMVGRLVEQKGVDDFIKTAAVIKKLFKNCSFIIVGNGRLKTELENMSIQHKIQIYFLGERTDVPQLLHIFDIFLMTSKWEPFGITVLEAMASGVPVVGYAVPGMREIVEMGGGGVLLKERNHFSLLKQ
jgi:glycosyltransferase involved in cell wall biosynthesis